MNILEKVDIFTLCLISEGRLLVSYIDYWFVVYGYYLKYIPSIHFFVKVTFLGGGRGLPVETRRPAGQCLKEL